MKEKISQMTQSTFYLYPTIRKSFRSLVALKSLPLSTTQLVCLNTVDTMENCTMSALAKELQMSNQQLTKVVDVLEEMGTVVRKYNEKNRRQVLVCTTDKGKKFLEDLRNEVSKKLEELFTSLPSEERNNLIDSILGLLDNLKHLDEKYLK